MAIIIDTKTTQVWPSATPTLLARGTTGSGEAIPWTVYTEAPLRVVGMTGSVAMLRAWVRFGSGNEPMVREFEVGRRFSVVARQIEVHAQIWQRLEGMTQVQRTTWKPIDPNGPDKRFFRADFRIAISPATIADPPPTYWVPPVMQAAPDYTLASHGRITSRGDPFKRGGGYYAQTGQLLDPWDREPANLYTVAGFNAGAATKWLMLFGATGAGGGLHMFTIPVKGGDPFSISLGPNGRSCVDGFDWVASSDPSHVVEDLTARFYVTAEIGGL